ncbi:MAG: acyltransferase [Cyanobacteria bacterium SIG28]|nr:acyltransferase [Cyanobacteria bacterium SIG28]
MKLLRIIFSVKNSNNHKILTILGFKFKFKFNNNKVLLYKNNGKIVKNPKIKGLKVIFNGENACVKIHEPCKFINSKICLYDNASVTIQKTKYQYNELYVNADYSTGFNLNIGENTSCGGLLIRSAAGSDISISIGKECAFSTDTVVQPIDGHWILDAKSGEILNKKVLPLIIGDHVWLGRFVKICKNVQIPANSIIGMGAIITKSFCEENVVIAGVPATVVKRGVNWQR